MAKTSIMNRTAAVSAEEHKALCEKLVAAVRAGRVALADVDDETTLESLEEDVSYMGAVTIKNLLISADEMADPSDPQLDPFEKMIESLEMYARAALQYAATPAQIRLLSKLAIERGEKAEGLIQGGMLSKAHASFMISNLKSEG